MNWMFCFLFTIMLYASSMRTYAFSRPYRLVAVGNICRHQLNFHSSTRNKYSLTAASKELFDRATLVEKPTINLIESEVEQAVRSAFADMLSSGEGDKTIDPLIFLAKPEHGDYQCNVAMPLAKKLKMKPRDIAANVMEAAVAGSSSVVGNMDISGPGFINIHLSESYIKEKLWTMLQLQNDEVRLGIAKATSPQRIVVDFSSPNIAKEMHVGHLRSTIIGDSLSKVLEFLGHDVLRLNHVGDWGTQFGMLIHYLKVNHPQALMEAEEDTEDNVDGEDVDKSRKKKDLAVDIGDLVEFYKAAKRCFDEDPAFKDAARSEVVKLQAGEPNSIRAWQGICEKSRVEFQCIYDRLGVTLEERGESFYNPILPGLVQSLKEGNVLVGSEGAQCIFLDGYKNSDGTPLPLIVQKSDGGYLYATTDLAALQHRVKEEGASRIIYVTDQGQAQHFEMVFKAAEVAGIVKIKSKDGKEDEGGGVELTHVPFGLVLGEDGKKIKSRAGDSVKLRELLDQAVEMAEENERSINKSSSQPEPSTGSAAAEPSTEVDEQVKKRAQIVGMGAVKYADLSMNRESNYRFSFKKMLSLSGNTAPYMLYAYVRIQGIQRKAAQALNTRTAAASEGTEGGEVQQRAEICQQLGGPQGLVLGSAAEVTLAKHLIRFHEVLLEVSLELYPNKLCDYIFELSQKFNQFYENCPVLKADTPELQTSRTALCILTSDTLKLSLDLLGIETVDKL